MRFLVFEKLSDLLKGEESLEHHHSYDTLFGVEVTLNDPMLLRRLTVTEYEKISSLLASYEKTVHLPFYGLNLGCFDRWIADYSEQTLLEGIVFCHRIGASRAVIHTTIPSYLGEDTRPRWTSRFLDRLEHLENYADRYGVTLVWENTYERDFSLFDAMITRVPSLKFCLDVGHVHCFAHRPFTDFGNHLGSRIIHMHLHDNDGIDDRHWPIGEGKINFAAVVGMLRHMAVDTIVFELAPDDFRTSMPWIAHYFRALFQPLPHKRENPLSL